MRWADDTEHPTGHSWGFCLDEENGPHWRIEVSYWDHTDVTIYTDEAEYQQALKDRGLWQSHTELAQESAQQDALESEGWIRLEGRK